MDSIDRYKVPFSSELSIFDSIDRYNVSLITISEFWTRSIVIRYYSDQNNRILDSIDCYNVFLTRSGRYKIDLIRITVFWTRSIVIRYHSHQNCQFLTRSIVINTNFIENCVFVFFQRWEFSIRFYRRRNNNSNFNLISKRRKICQCGANSNLFKKIILHS